MNTLIFVVDICDIESDSKLCCGAKAKNLAALARGGLPVPNGFCILANAYETHLDVNDLRECVDGFSEAGKGLSRENKAQAATALRKAIVKAPVPPAIRESIQSHLNKLSSPGFAVRSSATIEDLADHSFAGLYDSFLGVRTDEDCFTAIKRCWASLWTLRAIEYRDKKGIKDSAAAMAVVVQELAPAAAAGVAFSIDPVTGSRDVIVIESTHGLARPLIEGKVSPDRIKLSKTTFEIYDRSVGVHPLACRVSTDGAVVEEKIDDSGMSLSEALAKDLAEMVCRVEQLFGVPVDVEFAVSGEEISFVQARPITVLPDAPAKPGDDHIIWSNLNIGEVAPDVMTPATWSFVERFVDALLGYARQRIGINFRDHKTIGLVGGRAYFNLSVLLSAIRRIPGGNRIKLSKMFGGRQETTRELGQMKINENDLPSLGFSYGRFLNHLPNMLGMIFSYEANDAAEALHDIRCRADMEQVMTTEGLEPAELTTSILAVARNIETDTDVFDVIAMVQLFNMAFYEVCEKCFGEEGNAVASQLLTGRGSNENAEAGIDLWRLARSLRDVPALEATFRGASSFEKVRNEFETSGIGRKFLRQWDEFMATHGHHCRGELEFANERWCEAPDYIFGLVQTYVETPPDEGFVARCEARKSAATEAAQDAVKRIQNPILRKKFNFILRRTLELAPFRESIRSQVVRRIAAIRRLLLALGRVLTRQGVITCAEDTFFLKLDELDSISAMSVDDIRLLVARRRRQYMADLSVAPPPIVVGRFQPGKHPQEDVSSEREFKGIPVTPGVVTGTARVILHADDDYVRSGEILVAPFTDPGWTPYFINAAAIVVDLGGVLSHGSMIAREYGIPAVVNVGPATKVIENGQKLQVDGAKGIVRVVDEDNQ